MPFVLVERLEILNEHHFPVDAKAGIAVFADALNGFFVGPFLVRDDRSENLDFAPVFVTEDRVGHRGGGIRMDGFVVFRAIRGPDSREKQAEVVIDFRDGADARTRVVGCALLVDRDSRGKTIDRVDVRLIETPEELAGVRGKGFDVTPLPFGEDRVESQRAFARPGDAGENREGSLGYFHGYVLEVILAGPFDENVVL